MTQRLGAKMQRIIEDESGEVYSSDMVYPSLINPDYAYTTLNRHSNCRQYGEESSFLSPGFQTGHSLLDDFGMCHPSL